MAKKTRKKPPAPTPRESAELKIRQRMDGWMSALLGINTAKDKRTYTSFRAEPTNWQENTELWRGDDQIGRAHV